MLDEQLIAAVRERRTQGYSPKEIARALGVRPAAVAEIVRAVAVERGPEEAGPRLVGCWVSPGWSAGLTIDGHPEWRDETPIEPGTSGLAAVLVVREDGPGRVSVCGYLLDVYCLGVKDALGPRRMRRHELAAFVGSYYSAWESAPVAAQIELARHLVFGAIEYAAGLGFTPHRDFERARRHLGPCPGPSAIGFGRDGTPYYTEGPYDDAAQVMRTLNQTVGAGNFRFIVSAGAAGIGHLA
jgi:hypothetical protein